MPRDKLRPRQVVCPKPASHCTSAALHQGDRVSGQQLRPNWPDMAITTLRDGQGHPETKGGEASSPIYDRRRSRTQKSKNKEKCAIEMLELLERPGQGKKTTAGTVEEVEALLHHLV